MRTSEQIQANFDYVADDSVTYGQLQTELLMDIRKLLLVDIAAGFNLTEEKLVEGINEGTLQLSID